MNNENLATHGDHDGDPKAARGSNHAGQGSQSAVSSAEENHTELQPVRKGSSGQEDEELLSPEEEMSLDIHLEDQVDEEEFEASEPGRTDSSERKQEIQGNA